MSSSIVERIAEKLVSRKKVLSRVSLNQNNTYIFPTLHGFGFLLLLLLMLVAAINYQNSLIYLCIFFLGAVFFISIWMCFLNVSRLEVFSIASDGCFEGEVSKFRIGFQKKNSPVFGLSIGFDASSMEFVSVSESEVQFHELLLAGLKRGRHQAPKIRLESTYPFGFIRAWTWVRLDASTIVFPRQEYSPALGTGVQEDQSSHNQHAKGAEKDLLREYQQGEPLNRVSWKKFAATNELFVLDDEKISSNPMIVSWSDYDSASKESRLRYMCFRICELYEKENAFGIILPGNAIEAGFSKKHLEACLTALAEF